MDTKLEQYYEKFNDYFPMMSVMGYADDEIEDMIDKCIAENKTYEELYPTEIPDDPLDIIDI